jgi:Lrp/AsnC family leucine-responsive transcriptional regulator
VVELDVTDVRILSEFYKNARISYRELAKRVGLSTTAVMKRVNSLMDAGTIQGFVVMPSHAMIGAERFWTLLHTDGSEDEESLADSLGSLPEVHAVVRLVSPRGRSYLIYGNYIGSIRLSEIAAYLRRLDGVEEVELYNVIANWMRVSNWGRGEKMELTRPHLLVLKSLRQDPRMQVKELSEETGLSLRKARRLLREIEDSGAFYFMARTDPMVEGPTFRVKMRLADNEMTPPQLLSAMEAICGEHSYGFGFSVTEPVAFALIVGVDVLQMQRMFLEVERLPFVAAATPLMVLTYRAYPHLNQHKMDEILEGLAD